MASGFTAIPIRKVRFLARATNQSAASRLLASTAIIFYHRRIIYNYCTEVSSEEQILRTLYQGLITVKVSKAWGLGP